MPLLSFDDALARLLAAADQRSPIIASPLPACDGAVLARDLLAPMAVPGFDNSAMDGYALHIADFNAPADQFDIVQRIPAGTTGAPLVANSAARIFTGAPIPAGCNAVVPQEEAVASDSQLRLLAGIRPHQHIRRRGEDIADGSCVISAGTRLAPQHLALAASLGFAQLEIHAPLRVGLVCTGDELTQPGEPLPAGGIYNSNQFAIGALLQRSGCRVHDYGKVADTHAATLGALQLAAAENDVVISCGGVSVGEEDHVKAAVNELGTLDLWRIAMKPGKPLAFGKIGQADFIGLPGNPVSAFLTFVLLARPFLLRRMGASITAPSSWSVAAGFSRPLADPRREFLRGRLETDDKGQVKVVLYPSQGSAVMSGLAWADGLVDIAADAVINPGDIVRYLPLGPLIG